MAPTARSQGSEESPTQARMPEGSSDMEDVQLECQRLRHVRRSLERLCTELRHELQDAERRYKHATAQNRLLRREVEQGDRESNKARLRVRLLEKHAQRQACEFSEARRQFRLLQQRSSALAVGFLAITTSRRWHVGHALLSIPRRLIGRRTTTVADSLQTLASALATGKASGSDDRLDPSAGLGQADQGS